MSCPTGRCRKFGPCAYCLGLLPVPVEVEADAHDEGDEEETSYER